MILTNPCRRRGREKRSSGTSRATGTPSQTPHVLHLLLSVVFFKPASFACSIAFPLASELFLFFFLARPTHHPLRESSFFLKQVRMAQGDGTRILPYQQQRWNRVFWCHCWDRDARDFCSLVLGRKERGKHKGRSRKEAFFPRD